MKTTLWTCDLCGKRETAAYPETVDVYAPTAYTPAGWREFSDDRRVLDVCRECRTDEVWMEAKLSDILDGFYDLTAATAR